jgi:nicotinamide phosphoribosyltransferase
MKTNIILDTDSYKSSHWLQYPPNTVSMFSYLESRGGDYEETVFFGLQYILKEYLTQRVTREDVEEAAQFFKDHGEPFNYEGWMRVVNVHGGKLPLRIRAIPEGTVVRTHNALMTVESTDASCFWLVSWFETQLMRLWYPITVATLSREVKKAIKFALVMSADAPEQEIAFKLHDFGSRGVSSAESAALGGAAHLVNFMGSDTVLGVVMANRYYHSSMAGFSIPAAEHSSITSWGKDNEVEAYRNMLKQFAKPGSLVAVVSDSYDIYNAAENLWGDKLKQEVIDSGATVVVRPDSGDPTEVVVKLLGILDSRFGSTLNTKGYKVLNNVRVIQGDGCSPDTIKQMLKAVLAEGYSASNVAFGMGGALLQKVNRDTQKFAFKCSSITVQKTSPDGWVREEQRDVFKSPVTDTGKSSKAGRLDFLKDGTTVKLNWDQKVHPDSALVTVFENGEILVESTLTEIRERAKV